MNPLEWLSRRRELAVEAEINTLQPAQTPINPRAGSLSPRAVPDKSPRIPEEAYLNFCDKNILYSGKKQEEKNIIEARGNIERVGEFRELSGISQHAPDTAKVGGDFPAKPKVPYLAADGTLVIPFDSDPKYHWWKNGQSVHQTKEEVLAGIASETAPAVSVVSEHG